MSFLTGLALFIAGLAALPYFAHRLRRRKAEAIPFAAARFAKAAPPQARRRANLEDRPLFAVRALAILLLALLGATPFVHCSRLSLTRGGASVALILVLDDSMSMRAGEPSSRFVRAKEGAKELVTSLRDGDSVAIVLAGAPARVSLAPTTDTALATAALANADSTDRATDLDGALELAKALASELPQTDRRVILLSDLADGRPDAPPLASPLPMWNALPELAGSASDCGIVAADAQGSRVRVRLACSAGSTPKGRTIELVVGDKVIGTDTLGEALDVSLPLSSQDATRVVARLGPGDAIRSDDALPVLFQGGALAIGVVSDSIGEAAATGGAPVVEQALTALALGVQVQPLEQLPDHEGDLSRYAGLVVDDPPGLTPEQRRSLATYLQKGGAVLFALGPRSSQAPLGATFEPILSHPIAWQKSPESSVDPKSASAELVEAAETFLELDPKGRTQLAPGDVASLEQLLKWKDGAPFVGRVAHGRGAAWIVTLPFTVDTSDLVLRPGFLALLDAFAGDARSRTSPQRSDVGTPWMFGRTEDVVVTRPTAGATTNDKLTMTRDGKVQRVTPDRIGQYSVRVDGHESFRVASLVPRELDFRPRRVDTSGTGGSAGGGERSAKIDVSWAVALGLLVLFVVELGFRVRALSLAEASEPRADHPSADGSDREPLPPPPRRHPPDLDGAAPNDASG